MFKAIFTDNPGLKLFSLGIAIVLWFYVAITQNPRTEAKIRGIPVRVAYSSELKSRNLLIVHDPETTVDLTIQGPRSSVVKVDKTNTTATLDVSQVFTDGDVPLPIQFSFPSNDISVKSQSESSVFLKISSVIKKNVPLELRTSGAPASGYVVSGKPTSKATSVSIEGPHSEVQLVDHALALIDVTDSSSDLTQVLPISLCLSNGAKAEYKHITLETTETEVKVKIIPITTEAPQ